MALLVARRGLVFLAAVLLLSVVASAAEPLGRGTSLTDRSISWPSGEQWRRVLSMRDYNTRVVVLGTTLLGLAAGTIGSFTLLRKRALMGDALSHATLPGIGIAFIVATHLGYEGKSLPILLAGAAASGMLGVAAILFIRSLTRLSEDTALGIILSVFFGAGVAILGIVQQMESGHSAGLESFIYGKTASMLASDAWLIGGCGLGACAVCLLLMKELKLLCFDDDFASSVGYPTGLLDSLLLTLVVIVTIVGLQAVGLILVIAMLVTPAAAARFWTDRLSKMITISAAIGALSGMFGSIASALFPKLPSGAMIVLVATVFFIASMFAGRARGVLPRYLRRRRLNARIDRQHLLRGMFEHLESNARLSDVDDDAFSEPVPLAALFEMRSWSMKRLSAELREAAGEGLVDFDQASNDVRLTAPGYREASRLTHQHRLWEMYLITHADIAPSHVDRDADAIEHVLDSKMIDKLERLLHEQSAAMPKSPHPI